LGSERAEIVAEYMLEKGIPNEVIAEVVSKSYTEPLVPNTSEENRRQNRRVVILVINE
jgi:outer membrane protein OmpA-like peptidoglycan-associated protein